MAHGTCTECNHPLNDGEYFILTGDGEGIHHECPETCPICHEGVISGETVHALGSVYHKDCFDSKLPPFDRIVGGPSMAMKTSHHAARCPICSECIAHDEQTVLNGDDLCHFDCVREVNDDIDDLDGDAETALASAGFGTDEDYGFFGGCDD